MGGRKRFFDKEMNNTNNTYAALFDLDGVVFDTEGQYSIFWGEIGKEYHPEIENFEKIIKGQTLVQIYDKHFAHAVEDQPKITARLDAYEKSMAYNYIAGVENFIKELRQNGVKTAVVTSSNQPKMQQVYAQHPEFKEYFDEILTSEYFERSKPDPDCYLKGAQVFKLPIENCVVFEDSFNGLRAGQAAQMAVVGLATTNSPESIREYSDKVIADFTRFHYEDFLQLLQETSHI
jgi:HAD superfamily hydrolase (TIGR01509 family)